MGYPPDFEIVHVGVNCADAEQALGCAKLFETLFALKPNPEKDSADACFTGTQIEWMKVPGRGAHGHIALATADLPAARAYLEEKGMAFDEQSVKYFSDGRPMVVYAVGEIGGFAIHLMQK